METKETKFLIVGAGPTGLGAAWRLGEHGVEDWMLVEASSEAGGLAGSIVDENGFTWDQGGHVIFSHYDYFDRLLDELLKDQWNYKKRDASVWLYDDFIPYPFQNNIWRLPKEQLLAALDELFGIFKEPCQTRPLNFREWIEHSYGKVLSEIFFVPYNRKVWAHELEEMSYCWIGERVARVSIPQIVRNIVLQQDDVGWGPNAEFRFPKRGGTGEIWRTLCRRLPQSQVMLGNRIISIDPHKKIATLMRDGTGRATGADTDTRSAVTTGGDTGTRSADTVEIRYEYLISTMPMERLLSYLQGEPGLTEKSCCFKYSNVHIIGVGVDEPVPERFARKGWMYFPDPEIPFYRATIFSNYSEFNVPQPGMQWSILCEVSESRTKPVDQALIKDRVIEGLKRAKLLTGHEKLASVFHRRLEHGYPTPFLERDELLAEVEPRLREMNIWSRGRFGGWRYEVANQDHSLMQGVEAVDHILMGTEESTYFFPSKVNAGPKMPVMPIPSGTTSKGSAGGSARGRGESSPV